MAELELCKPLQDDINDDSTDNLATQNSNVSKPRKTVFRRTIDYFASHTVYLEQIMSKPSYGRRRHIQPDVMYQHYLTPPIDYNDNPMNCVCTKHIRTSTNKNKCPIYVVCWTPDGRRLITGASSGEFTLWNGLTFNFETILQAHETHIRTMKWSYNEEWLLSADDAGMVKYWQANMNDVNVFQAHKDSIRGLSFSPTDEKFATCSNDNTVRIFDFRSNKEERVLRGHGGEARCVAWHPTKSLIISGSKDSQQPIKLWDPKAGNNLSTLYVHKSTVTDIAINDNGNWFLSASKDHQIKLFDLRNLKSELQVFRGHKKDVIRVAWHPIHEQLFASGSGDGALMYWMANPVSQYDSGMDFYNTNNYQLSSNITSDSNEVGVVDDAHENIIWSIDWHPLGHLLATGSNDFATKFWTRHRPGDLLRDPNVPNATNAQHNVSGEIKSSSLDSEVNPVSIDLNRLTSYIQADLDQSELVPPGLVKKLKQESVESTVNSTTNGHLDDSFMNHDSNIDDDDASVNAELKAEMKANQKGGVTRSVPRRFAELWLDKNSKPLALQMAPIAIGGDSGMSSRLIHKTEPDYPGAQEEPLLMQPPGDKPVFRGRAPMLDEPGSVPTTASAGNPPMVVPTSVPVLVPPGPLAAPQLVPPPPQQQVPAPHPIPPSIPSGAPRNMYIPPGGGSPVGNIRHGPPNQPVMGMPQPRMRPMAAPVAPGNQYNNVPIRPAHPNPRMNAPPRFSQQPIRNMHHPPQSQQHPPPLPPHQPSLENPFEPQSDTGSSLGYIPLSGDDRKYSLDQDSDFRRSGNAGNGTYNNHHQHQRQFNNQPHHRGNRNFNEEFEDERLNSHDYNHHGDGNYRDNEFEERGFHENVNNREMMNEDEEEGYRWNDEQQQSGGREPPYPRRGPGFKRRGAPDFHHQHHQMGPSRPVRPRLPNHQNMEFKQHNQHSGHRGGGSDRGSFNQFRGAQRRNHPIGHRPRRY